MTITTDQEVLLKQAAEDFKKAMEIRSAMNLRVARRVTSILRISMVSFGLVTLVLLVMLFAFTSKMDEMIVALDTMNGQFTSISKDMAVMNVTIHEMERNIAYVPVITNVTKDMSLSVSNMRNQVENMNGTIASLNYQVYDITAQLEKITGEMRSLDPAVRSVGRDVNRMSGPMRMFNKFNPVD